MADRNAALAAATAFVGAQNPASWSPEDLAVKRMQLFSAAQRGSSDIIHSLRHSRATRTTRFVTVTRRLESGREAVHVAEVLYFLRCQHEDAVVPSLRLAVCKQYAEQPKLEGMFVARETTVRAVSIAVRLDSLGAVLVVARPRSEGKIYGMQYINQSRFT